MNPGEVTTVIMKFDLPKAPFDVPPSPRTGGYEYVWHCHILDHEDNEIPFLPAAQKNRRTGDEQNQENQQIIIHLFLRLPHNDDVAERQILGRAETVPAGFQRGLLHKPDA